MSIKDLWLSKNPFTCFTWAQTDPELKQFTRMQWFGPEWPTSLTNHAEAVQYLNSLPDGKRCMFFWWGCSDLLTLDKLKGPDGEDYRTLWPSTAITKWQTITHDYFSRFKELGGKVDYVFMDYEDGIANWTIGDKPNQYLAIAQAPQFEALRQRLGMTLEHFLLIPDFWHYKHYQKFNAVGAGMKDAYMNEAMFNVAKSLYPNLRAFCDGSITVSPEHWFYELNGHHSWYETAGYGTHDSYEMYGGYAGLSNNVEVLGTGAPLGSTAWTALIYQLNIMRAQHRSTKRPFLPILCYNSFYPNEIAASSLNNTPYYLENVFHMAAMGCNTFMYWNPKGQTGGATAADDELLNGVITEAAAMVPYQGQAVTDAKVSWTSEYVATGFRMCSQQVWRVSFKDPTKSIEVNLDGYKKVLFPNGKHGQWVKV